MVLARLRVGTYLNSGACHALLLDKGVFQGVSNFAINGMVLVVFYTGGTLVGRNEISGVA